MSFPLIFPAFITVFHDITELIMYRSTFGTPHDMIALLACLPLLEKVEVDADFPSNWLSSQALPVPPEPPHSLKAVQLSLSSLYQDPWSCILDWIAQSPPTVCALKLRALPSTSLPAFRTVLCALGPTLYDLYLCLRSGVSSHDIETVLSPHLGCLTQLTHLTICINLLAQRDPPHAHLDAYSALLDALPREPAVVETLTLNILYVFTLKHLVLFDWVRFCVAARAHTRLRLLRFLAHERTPNDEAVLEKLRNRVVSDFAARVSVEVEWDAPLL
ncbi:hypothetical protein GGX14DRAFT_701390 [Mycena pura]|uniref:Uncharacterized protein n=1 Tax=Mycena pura TaxID=153505 RepID=A0AAD6UU61_9AGAR|nr:hypothetical protein GGX14DRAFT_701390 [Mycena pura]